MARTGRGLHRRPRPPQISASIAPVLLMLARMCLLGSQLAFAALVVVAPVSLGWVFLETAARNADAPPHTMIPVIAHLSDVGVVAVLALWLLAHLLDGERRIALRMPLLLGAMAGLVGLSFLSALWAATPVLATTMGIRLLLLLGLTVYISNEVTDRRLVTLAFAVMVATQSVVAAGQFVAQRTLGLAALGEPSFALTVWGSAIIEIGPQRWLRTYGLTPHPNILAVYLLVGELIMVGGLLMARRSYATVPLGAVLALGAAGLIATFSRAAWLGLLIGSMLIFFTYARTKSFRAIVRPLVVLAVVLVIVVAPLVLHYQALFATRLLPLAYLAGQPGMTLDQLAGTLEHDNITGRLESQQRALSLIAAHPLTGIGAGNYAANVYNPALLIGVELGLPGLVLWATISLSPLLVTVARWRSIRGSPDALLCSVIVLALILASQFNPDTWSSPQGRLLLWMAIGLWIARAGVPVDRPTRSNDYAAPSP